MCDSNELVVSVELSTTDVLIGENTSISEAGNESNIPKYRPDRFPYNQDESLRSILSGPRKESSDCLSIGI